MLTKMCADHGQGDIQVPFSSGGEWVTAGLGKGT